MFHSLSVRLASMCKLRGWITADEIEWCIYVFEKKLGQFLFLLAFFIISLCCGKILEAGAFVVTFFGLRRYIGGWHAKHAWSCQLFSALLLVFILTIVGPVMSSTSIIFTIALDSICVMLLIILKPVYPKQLHFSETVMHLNNKKKKQILFLIVTIQILCALHGNLVVMIYSTLGILVSAFALITEMHNQHRKKDSYDEN